MARCGRCGLWTKTPEDAREQRYAGTCLYYQTRLEEDQVYEERDCGDFFESLPGLTPIQQFDYKVKRDGLRDAYITARRAEKQAVRARRMAIFGVVMSLIGMGLSVFGLFPEN